MDMWIGIESKSIVIDTNGVGVRKSESGIWHMWNPKFVAVKKHGMGEVKKIRAMAESKSVNRYISTQMLKYINHDAYAMSRQHHATS